MLTLPELRQKRKEETFRGIYYQSLFFSVQKLNMQFKLIFQSVCIIFILPYFFKQVLHRTHLPITWHQQEENKEATVVLYLGGGGFQSQVQLSFTILTAFKEIGIFHIHTQNCKILQNTSEKILTMMQ